MCKSASPSISALAFWSCAAACAATISSSHSEMTVPIRRRLTLKPCSTTSICWLSVAACRCSSSNARSAVARAARSSTRRRCSADASSTARRRLCAVTAAIPVALVPAADEPAELAAYEDASREPGATALSSWSSDWLVLAEEARFMRRAAICATSVIRSDSKTTASPPPAGAGCGSAESPGATSPSPFCVRGMASNVTAPVSFSPYSLRRATQASSPLMADARSGVAVGRVGVLRGGARRSGSWRGCLVGEAIMKRSTAFRNSSSSGGGAGGE